MKFSKFLISKLFFILVVSPLFFNAPKAYTAEEIKITYSLFSRTIKVNSLKTFAKEGKSTKKLKRILKATGSPDDEIRTVLNKDFEIPITIASKLIYSEIGNVFHKKTEFIQEEVLNGAIYGNKKFGKWINSGKDNDLNYFQARGKLKEALSSLKIKIDDKPTDSIDFLHPGRTAKLFIEGKDAGYFGEILPKLILEKKSLKKVYLFSINVSNLLGASTRKNKWIPIYQQYPIVPKMERDINFVFSKKFLISDITSQIRKTGKNLLEDVYLIDVFEDIKFGMII